ncbi:hypothetical protein [Listeria floridensis]|uniref:hypothetical protein n=1 Tax=Listeria floridensis TaxID=1494962 RepID=UPI0012DC2EE2|nr:hypothetical protein [Listeria floridensis]
MNEKKVQQAMTMDVAKASKDQGREWVKSLAEQRKALIDDGAEKKKNSRKKSNGCLREE